MMITQILVNEDSLPISFSAASFPRKRESGLFARQSLDARLREHDERAAHGEF
jgi:hypothetical protein